MGKNTFLNFIFLILSIPVFSQITVDDSSFTVTQLVEDVLIDSPCAQVNNISSFTGTADGFNGIGFFEANGSGFEIERGVVLSTGNALSAAGPNGATSLSEGDGTGWGGDNDLSSITGTSNLLNASYIQFDFVPTIEFISFDFMFASEEYTSNFACTFSDVFAFILTDPDGNSTNLAVVPGSDPAIPISVTTVHPGVDLNGDGDYTDVIGGLAECAPQNPGHFNTTVLPGTDSPIDFNGYTNVLTASGSVVPNQQYTIKLVIADNVDGQFDSAVFLAAGSFNLGGDLGEDRTISSGNPGCIGDPIILDATIGSGSTYTWLKDGLPLAPGDGTTLLSGGARLEVTQNGTYSVEVSISSGCTATDSVDIEFVQPPTIANTLTNLISCDADGDGFESFDLTVNTSLAMGAQDSSVFTVTYHLTQEDAENYSGASTDNRIDTPSDFTNTSPDQIVWLRIAETSQTCFEIGSFTLRVLSDPEANQPTDYQICDNNEDGNDSNGIVTFDLSVKIAEVLGSQDVSEFSVQFYESQSAADAGVAGTELPGMYDNISNPQLIFVRIENNIDGRCYETTSFQLIVNPLPVVIADVALLQCDDDTDGFSLFNLTEANSLISANSANETFTYYLTEALAINGDVSDQITNFTAYANPTTLNSVVFARIVSEQGCFRTAQINLQVSATQIPSNFNLTYTICESENIDDDPTDGIATFDFSDASAQISSLYPAGQNLTIRYYQNEADALAEQNEITDVSSYRNTSSPFLQELYVRVEDGSNNACLGLGEHITLQVNPFDDFTFQEEYTICLQGDGSFISLMPENSIDTQLDVSRYSFQWYVGETPAAGNEIPGETDASFVPSIPGSYSVLVTGITTGCTLIRNTTVIESYPPESIRAELLSGAFSDNARIEVIVEGNGEYLFRLDSGDWQESNIFSNVSRGEHRVFVRDIRSCGELEYELEPIVGYPMYFTPNGDGFHDNWTITGSENVVITSIRIFDRFGKLLKDLGSAGSWDGTYNGRLLPSNDYWFRVTYIEENIPKEFKASFSLVR